MIATETAITKKKLKIKFGNQRIEAVSGTISCEYEQQLLVSASGHHRSSLNESNQLEMTKYCQASNGKRMAVPEYLKERSSNVAGKKREQLEVMECPKEKRRKMDRSVTQQCSNLLKSLMGHPAGWVFNQPVDPVKLNIPDYFSIVSKPMDLGTIKSRLVKKMYSGTDEFVADVRLTFANAMLYNPPQNNVHKMAEELNNLFEVKWKSLEEQLSRDKPKVGLAKILNGRMTEVNDTGYNRPKTPPLQNALSSRKSKTSQEKVVRSLSHATVASVEQPKPAQSCSSKLVLKNSLKGADGGGRLACSVVNAKPPLSPVSCQRCGKFVSNTCGCSLSSDSTLASSDITSERSLVGESRACSADVAKLDCQAKSTSTSQMSKSDPDSDGAVSALDDGNLCPSSQLTPPATKSDSAAVWTTPLLDVQMSPKKALRAAMLKSRFADTILKAQKKTLLDHVDKADPVKLQQEKERLEKMQREEKARIEAQIIAAEAASRKKAEIEYKKQREKEREAARIALEKVEKTVEIEHNLEIIKELETLTGCCLRGQCGSKVSTKPQNDNPLEQFGLVLKNEYLREEEEEDDEILNPKGEGEEGEIL